MWTVESVPTEPCDARVMATGRDEVGSPSRARPALQSTDVHYLNIFASTLYTSSDPTHADCIAEHSRFQRML